MLTSVGELGVVAGAFDPEANRVDVRHWPALPLRCGAVNVTGAGDSFVGGCIAALLRGNPIDAAIEQGLVCARASVESELPVCPELDGDQ